MSNSYLTNAASIAGAGREQGLSLQETAEALIEKKARKAQLREAAMARRVGNEGAADFDFTGNDVPAALAGFNYGNGGEDIEFGVDQADWQVAQADDKDIVARNRRRAEQAAADIAIDQAMRGDNIIARNKVVRQLDRERQREQNPDGRTDWRRQGGDRIKEDPFLVGRRGPDHNLVDVPERLVRFMGRKEYDKEGNLINVRAPQREALEREPQVPLGFEDPSARNQRMISAIRRDRREAAAVRNADAVGLAGILRAVENDADAGLEAMILGRRQGINRNMDAIPNIKDVGHVKQKLPAKAGGFNEGQFFPVAAQDGIAPAFDTNGMPLGIQGPTPANSIDPGQVVNAPRDVRQWAIQNAPGFKDGGRVFGDFPQVDIGGVGNDFLARIAKIKAKGQAFDPGISAIRNIEDLDRVVNRFGDFQQAGGLKAFHLDANNKEVFVDRAGLPEIFQKMKMNANGQGRLANAIFQLEAAKANGVNNERRAIFEGRAVPAQPWRSDSNNNVQFGAQIPEFGNDEAQLQKIPRGQIKIGVDAVGEPIKQEMMAALQGLQGNQAQPPLDANELRDARNGLVGLVQGEGRGRKFGFAKKLPEGAEPRAFFRAQAEARAKPGKAIDIGRVNKNADAWQRIVDREKAARNAPNQVLGVVGPAERELQAKGANFPMNRGAFVPEGNDEWKKNPALFQNEGEPRIGNVDDMKRVMPSASAARAAAPPPRVRAEGAGMGGGGTRPPSVVAAATPDPWQTPPATGGGFTEQSVAPEQSRLQGMRDSVINSLKQGRDKFNAAPRRQRYGAAGGAALLGVAGLSSLIGGERDRREEEVYS